MAFVKFITAKSTYDDDGVLRFVPGKAIWINPNLVESYEDHVVNGLVHKYVVMDDAYSIFRKLDREEVSR